MADETQNISRHDEAPGSLPASETRYRRLFESARDGILILDVVNQKIIDLNESVIQLLGYSREEILGRELWEIGLFADQEEGQAAFLELQATGHLRYHSLPLETDSGEPHYAELICSVYEEDMRQLVQCNIREITERQRAEFVLREQASLLGDAQHIGRMGNWSLDLHTGRLVWSAATCELFGITPAEFSETVEHFYSFILPEDLPVYEAVLALVSPAHSLFEAEYRIRRPDDAVRWLIERGKVEFDAAGVPIGRVGIMMDITERHAVREQLAESAALLAQIAGKAARLGGWTIQLPERTLTWSDENCVIHDLPPGYTPTIEEGIGYFPPEHRAQVMQYVDACARDGTPYDFELPKVTAKGRQIWVRSIGEAVRDAEGKIIRIQGAFQDITVRKQIEAEREKLIDDLQRAFAEVNTLREFLPICSYCRKVRDDQNYWSQIENYLSDHTNTKFSHGICPECYQKEIEPELEEMRRRSAEGRERDALSGRLRKL